MQTIDIHLSEMAGWRALLAKAQFVAALDLHTEIEEYLVRLLFTRQGNLVDIDAFLPSADGSKLETSSDTGDLKVIGDHCLLFAGLYPEQAIVKNIPVSYFVKVGQAAYREFGRCTQQAVFVVLSEIFVDIMDVLHTLRDVDEKQVCIDPMNAYELWSETGSAHSWHMLRDLTSSIPIAEINATSH